MRVNPVTAEAARSSLLPAHSSLVPSLTLLARAPLFLCVQGGGEPRLWFLTLHCDKDYPKKAPTLRFTSKITLDSVDARGNVRVLVACLLHRLHRLHRSLLMNYPFVHLSAGAAEQGAVPEQLGRLEDDARRFDGAEKPNRPRAALPARRRPHVLTSKGGLLEDDSVFVVSK